MSISMANAAPKKRTDEEKKKLKPGTYVCVVSDCKLVDSPMLGQGFVLEGVVESGPHDIGRQADFSVFPDAPRKPSRMPPAKARELDLGKIQRVVAAVYGLPAARQFEIDDAKFASATAKPVSPLRGRKYIIEAIPRVGADGKPMLNDPAYYYEITPFTNDSGLHGAAAKAAMPPKAPPLAKTLESVLAVTGFAVHPEDSDYVFKGDEVVELAEFRKQHGL